MPMDQVLKNFEDYCAKHGERVTPPRRAVYAALLKSDQPMSAYDLLDSLKTALNNPKPPTVYRALEFLQAHGFVHRIESLNVYVTCGAGHRHNGSQFMICSKCGRVEEAHLCHVPKGLQEQVDARGFKVSHWNAELHGLCESCV